MRPAASTMPATAARPASTRRAEAVEGCHAWMPHRQPAAGASCAGSASQEASSQRPPPGHDVVFCAAMRRSPSAPPSTLQARRPNSGEGISGSSSMGVPNAFRGWSSDARASSRPRAGFVRVWSLRGAGALPRRVVSQRKGAGSAMPVAPLREILDPAFEQRYGVAAFNVVDDVSLQAVIDAATALEAPLIVQTSVKTVKSFGAEVLYGMFRPMADAAPVPIALHLDHCPDREWATRCLRTGWNSVLFDGSHLDIDENTRQT